MTRRRDAAVALSLLVLVTTLALAERHGAGAGRSASPIPGLEMGGAALGGERANLRARAAGRAIDRFLRHRQAIRRGSRREREVALTFDDGPSPYTAPILRVLHRAHAQATFFPVGTMMNRYPRAFASLVHAGFPIGDHTLTHPPLPPLRARAQRTEIRGQARFLHREGAPWPRLFRPPYGTYDRSTLRILRRERMLMVLWSIDSQDYRRPGRGNIVRNVVGSARPGAIVLMHDGGGPREQTAAALPAIIRGLRHKGYRLVTVRELLFIRPNSS